MPRARGGAEVPGEEGHHGCLVLLRCEFVEIHVSGAGHDPPLFVGPRRRGEQALCLRQSGTAVFAALRDQQRFPQLPNPVDRAQVAF